MTPWASIGAGSAGFLCAVLWFDLMFDVQTRTVKDGSPPDAVLNSIAAYYRRVTTDARPMNRLVPLAMLANIFANGFEIAQHIALAWLSLAIALSAIGLAFARTVRDAVRLGSAQGPAIDRSKLARSIFRDHAYCFAAMSIVLAIQILLAFD